MQAGRDVKRKTQSRADVAHRVSCCDRERCLPDESSRRTERYARQGAESRRYRLNGVRFCRPRSGEWKRGCLSVPANPLPLRLESLSRQSRLPRSARWSRGNDIQLELSARNRRSRTRLLVAREEILRSIGAPEDKQVLFTVLGGRCQHLHRRPDLGPLNAEGTAWRQCWLSEGGAVY